MTDLASLYPKYEYTYEVVALHYESGHIEVKYTPVNEKLTSVTLNILIKPDLDPNNLKPYLDQFAPNHRWYGQELILNNSDALMGK